MARDNDARLCDIAAELRHETPAAYLICDGGKPVWVPKSQCEVEGPEVGSNLVTVTMPEWLAKEKGLI